MAFQNCPNICEVVYHSTVNAREVANVTHAYKATGWTAGGVQTLAENMRDAYMAHIAPLLSEDAVLISVSTRDLTTETGAFGLATQVAGLGSIAGEVLPPSVAMCVTLRTAYIGRSFRGRLYQAGLPLGSVENGVFTAGITAAVEAAWEEMRAHYTSIVGSQMTILSRWHDKAKRTEGIGQAVTNIQCNTGVDTMRKRKLDPAGWIG